MASFVHPNLAMIFAAESWLGLPLLVVEYLAGGTLDALLLRRRFTESEAIELGIALTEATACLHEAGVLHRDIKPSNIGFTQGGTPKLLDFGLAKVVHETGAEPRAASEPPAQGPDEAATLSVMMVSRRRRVVGTPLYLSPEAADGERPEPDFDLWSLAMTLYEVVAGGHPLAERTPQEVLEALRSRPLPSIRETAPGCSEPLAAFLDRALAPDRRARLTDLASFREELRKAGRAQASR